MPSFEEREKPAIEIFEAAPEDVAGIVAVQKETWLATYPNEEYGITEEDILSKDWDSPDRIARWQKTIIEGSDANRLWIAKEREKVVGVCSVSKGDNQNQVRAIYVLPEYQGKGVGKKLLEKAFDWLGDEKNTVLGVVKYNTNAIEFYKKFGFEGEREVPSSPAGQLPSGKLLPEIEMIKPRKEKSE
jgi:ribosomal protein S18 acetylase RimI-like enzyme